MAMRGNPTVEFLGQQFQHAVMTRLHRQACAWGIEVETVDRAVELDTVAEPLVVLGVIRGPRMGELGESRSYVLSRSSP